MKKLLIPILISIVITFIYLIISRTDFAEKFEYQFLDLSLNLRGTLPPPDDIVIIAMDEMSYGALNIPLNQPWPRALHAELLKKLKEYEVKRVAFDVLFLGESLAPKTDTALAESAKNVPVIVGVESVTKEHTSSGGSFAIEEVLTPYPSLLENASGTGLVGLPEDYGAVRRFLSKRSKLTEKLPTLSESAASFQGAPPGPRDLINYYGPRGTIYTLSYYQLLEKTKPLPKEILKDKIVFVGLVLSTDVGPSQKDIFLTPFGSVFGTEIHATATANLISGNWIRRSSIWSERILFGALSFILTLILLCVTPLWGVGIVTLALLLWFIGSYLSLLNYIYIPGATLFVATLPLVLLGSTLYYYFVTRRSQINTQAAFERYLSPEMAREVAKNPAALSLGGEKVWATAMFTDIASFSSITEEMPAETVAGMLNAYFTEVMEVVFENGGTLIKFIGDAAFVLWGAPVKINDHTVKAFETALAIEARVDRFNATKRYPPLNTRIGIHTGPMLVGNLGSARRFDYTAIGDSVNLASRVEGINKYLGTKILITETAKKELGGSYNLLCVGSIQVVGKKEIIPVYTAFRDPIPDRITDIWNEAIANFKSKNWKEAIKLFSEVSQLEQRLKEASSLYIRLSNKFISNPPELDWLGEIIFLDK